MKLSLPKSIGKEYNLLLLLVLDRNIDIDCVVTILSTLGARGGKTDTATIDCN